MRANAQDNKDLFLCILDFDLLALLDGDSRE